MAIAKLTQRIAVIRSRRNSTANMAVATGSVRLIMAALLAREIRVPQVIITCAGKDAERRQQQVDADTFGRRTRARCGVRSRSTNGISMSIASVIGPQTVNIGPTWSCTSLMQVNCSAHIRLQQNRNNQERIQIFPASRICSASLRIS